MIMSISVYLKWNYLFTHIYIEFYSTPFLLKYVLHNKYRMKRRQAKWYSPLWYLTMYECISFMSKLETKDMVSTSKSLRLRQKTMKHSSIITLWMIPGTLAVFFARESQKHVKTRRWRLHWVTTLERIILTLCKMITCHIYIYFNGMC